MSTQSEQEQVILVRALEYAKVKDWPVFPIFYASGGKCQCGKAECRRKGKHPRTSGGFKDATLDPEKIKSWFQRIANVGIATGNGLFVLDIDPEKGGDISLRTLEEEHGELPETYTVLTGGGGYHYYFTVSERIQSRNDLFAGIDIKCDGGYVVAPPSQHESGKQYLQDVGQPTICAEAPPWLVNLCLVKSDPMADTPDFIVEGGRNEWLASMAGAIRRKGADENAIIKLLLELNATKCKPPLEEDEVVKIAKSIAQYPPEGNQAWQSLLKRNEKGFSQATAANAAIYLTFRDEWHGVLGFDEFHNKVTFRSAPPEGFMRPEVGDSWDERSVVYAQHWLAKNCGPNFALDTVDTAARAVANRNRFHPVKDWLESLSWDGVERLDRWLPMLGGAEDSELVRKIGRWWLISAIARAYEPGCQADHVLVLEGRQGIGKTSLCRALGGKWYVGNMPNVADKYAAMHLEGGWIVEVGEFDAFSGTHRARVKDFITLNFDKFKKPYARDHVTRPRHCVFVATTNETHYLDDVENRRFWPVKIQSRPLVPKLLQCREALFAEAVEAYKSGEKWFPQFKDMSQLEEAQTERVTLDGWESRVENLLARKYSEMGNAAYVTVDAIYEALGLEPRNITTGTGQRIGKICKRNGWMQVRRLISGTRHRIYVPTKYGIPNNK